MPADRLEAAGAAAAGDPAGGRSGGRSGGSGGGAGGSVAVIGGGVSGLVAARELALAGADVVLLEAGDRLGGRVRRETVAGAPIDIGAEAFATRGGGVAALLAELGLGGEIVSPAPLGSWVVTGAGAVPLPAAGTIGIPAAPLARDAVRALGVVGALRAAAEPLLPRSVGRGGSLAELVRARLGKRVLERLVRPVVLGVHSSDPADMRIDSVPGLAAAFERRGSLVAAARELRDSRTAAGGAVAGLRGGMADLVEALAAELDRLGATVRTGTRVGGLTRVEDRGAWRVTGEDPAAAAAAAAAAAPAAGAAAGAGDDPASAAGADPASGPGALVEADAVVLAVPEDVARRLLHAPPSDPAGRVEVVALLVEDPWLDRAPRGTGALVAADAAPRITAKALTHVTAKWPARAAALGEGRHVLRLSYGRVGSAPATEGLSDEETSRLAIRDASRILGVELREDSVRGMRRREWIAGAPGADAAPIPERSGIALAGDWVSGTGLASAIPGARSAARRILDTMLQEGGRLPADPREPNRTAPNRTAPNRTAPNSTAPHGTAPHGTAAPHHEGVQQR